VTITTGRNVLPVGSYNSAEPREKPLESEPPATRTCPFGSRVAVASYRTADIDPAGTNVPLAGSYSSAERK
jgi:hypothetical protein